MTTITDNTSMDCDSAIVATTAAPSNVGEINKSLYRHLILTDADERWKEVGTWDIFKTSAPGIFIFGQHVLSAKVEPAQRFPILRPVDFLNHSPSLLACTNILDIKSCCGKGNNLPPLPLPSLDVVRILKDCDKVHTDLPKCATLIMDGNSDFKVNLNPSHLKRLVITLSSSPDSDISETPLICSPLVNWSAGGKLEEVVLICKQEMSEFNVLYLADWLLQFLCEVEEAGIVLDRVVLVGINGALFNSLYASVMGMRDDMETGPFGSWTSLRDPSSFRTMNKVFYSPEGYAQALGDDREWLRLALDG